MMILLGVACGLCGSLAGQLGYSVVRRILLARHRAKTFRIAGEAMKDAIKAAQGK